MRKLFYIVIIGIVLYFIYRHFVKTTRQTTLQSAAPSTGPSQTINPSELNIVVDLIGNTPAWLEEIKRLAKNHKVCRKPGSIGNILTFGTNRCNKQPIPWQDMLQREAKRHLKKRGLQDIQANPLSFADYPRPETTIEMEKRLE